MAFKLKFQKVISRIIAYIFSKKCWAWKDSGETEGRAEAKAGACVAETAWSWAPSARCAPLAVLPRLRPGPGRRAGWRRRRATPCSPVWPHPSGEPRLAPSEVEHPERYSPRRHRAHRLRPAGPQPAVLSGAAGRWTPWELFLLLLLLGMAAKKVKCRTLSTQTLPPSGTESSGCGSVGLHTSRVGQLFPECGREAGTYAAWAGAWGPRRDPQTDTPPAPCRGPACASGLGLP